MLATCFSFALLIYLLAHTGDIYYTELATPGELQSKQGYFCRRAFFCFISCLGWLHGSFFFFSSFSFGFFRSLKTNCLSLPNLYVALFIPDSNHNYIFSLLCNYRRGSDTPGGLFQAGGKVNPAENGCIPRINLSTTHTNQGSRMMPWLEGVSRSSIYTTCGHEQSLDTHEPGFLGSSKFQARLILEQGIFEINSI